MGFVRSWRSESGVPPESGLAVALGDDIDILSSGLLINCHGRHGQNLLPPYLLDPADPLLLYF